MTDEERTITALKKWNDISMHHAMRSFIRYAKENNISMSQVGAIFHLRHKGTLGVTDLSEHLGVTSAAASQMIDRLVQQNLIERNEDPNDRRVRQLSLTMQGQALLAESIRIQGAWIRNLVNALSDDEKNRVFDALQILITKAGLPGTEHQENDRQEIP